MTLPPLPFTGKPIRRVTGMPPEEVLALSLQEPLVVTGAMEEWELYRRVRAGRTPEQKLAVLEEMLGQSPVTYHRLPRAQRGHYHFQDTTERLTFGEGQTQQEAPFVDFTRQVLQHLRAEQGDYVYMQAQPILEGSPLLGALGPRFMSFLPEDERMFAALWVGTPGQVVNLHYDDFLTCICQVAGIKRVTLFSPELLGSLYPAPFDRMLQYCQASLVRMLEPDLERHPLFARALEDARVVELQPGEVLLMPPMWWHHVESFGLNIMVNNRAFLIPLERFEEVYTNITQAVRLFHPCSAEQRARARELYWQTLFAPGAPVRPGPAQAALLAQETPEQARHREETSTLVANVPEFLRQHLARYYAYFIFQTAGDPYPTLPGAFATMVERNAHAPTFFAR